MTIAVLLRSGMMRKYHVPFWRAVGGVTHLLTLLDKKSLPSQSYSTGRLGAILYHA